MKSPRLKLLIHISVCALLGSIIWGTASTSIAVVQRKKTPLKAPDSGDKPGAASTPDAAASLPPSNLVVLTRAVGEVGDHVVTSREARFDDAIEQALNGKPPGPDGFRVLTGLEKTFPGEVSRTLDEWVVFLEAKSLNGQPTSGDVGTSIKAVQDRWGGNPAWIKLEVSPEELRQTVERKLIAREFERLKSDPQLAPVSDDDALSYFRQNRLRFGNLPFSSFKENIKAFLVKQQTERRLAEWREVLRKKYKVRNFIAG